MIEWPETQFNLTTEEEHGILLSFLHRFNEKFIAVLCDDVCNIRYFALEEVDLDLEHSNECQNAIKSLNPLDFVSQQLLEKFSSLHFLNQIHIILKFYYLYVGAPYMSYCVACGAVWLVPTGYYTNVGEYFCQTRRCDTCFCKECTDIRDLPSDLELWGSDVECPKHNTLFEALYFYVFDQQRTIEFEKRITTYNWQRPMTIEFS